MQVYVQLLSRAHTSAHEDIDMEREVDLGSIPQNARPSMLDLHSLSNEVTENKLDLGSPSFEEMKNKLDLSAFNAFLQSLESTFRNSVETYEISTGLLSFARRYYYEEEANAKLKPSRDRYPRTGQLGFVDHLVENLDYLVKHKPHPIGVLKPNILNLQKKLQGVSCKLKEIEEPRKEDGDFKALIQSFTNLAYEVEYTIDSYLVGDALIWYTRFLLDDILDELHITESNIEIASGKPESIIRLICLEHSQEPCIVPILHNPQELDIISNGSEISDKVREFFCHPTLKSAYRVRTWCLVSSYKERKKKVLLQLLHNAEYGGPQFQQIENKKYVHGHTSHMSEDKLRREVCKFLHYKSYVVILEDVRDINALINIVSALPKSCNGMVLVITPSPEVALKCRYFSEGVLDEMPGDLTSTYQTNKPTIDNDVVGFLQETQMMRERLIGESKQLCIISIVGMAGQGKTTLAMKLFNDHSVVEYFHIRLWCNVSQVYENRGLLLELLGQVIQLSKIIFDKSDEELAEILYKHLKGRRFLVYLDDVWAIDAWYNLSRCFPNDNNGSRIMFTTRIEELASQVKSKSVVQQLCPLSHEESWELLKKKVFLAESCPPELLGVGKKIAKKCNGLPLSIVLIAGILEKLEKNVGRWEHIATTLSSRILSDVGAQAKSIIEMSYKHLPDHLRPCFLYFGVFLEDREVLVSKLIRLWIAEGFVKHTHLKMLEDVGEDYLMDLIGRSLVAVAQEKSNGGVKLCRVHDLLYEFCFTKAKEDNFMQQINGYDKHFRSSRIHLRRFCIHSKRDQFGTLKASNTFVRSLLFFATSDLGSSNSYDISFICRNFKLVTILDLEDIKIGDSFEKINILVLLRYLAVQSYVDSIPSSIANLWNLETFIFKGLSNNVVKVPYSICDMAKLRHVHISESASFYLVPDRPEMSFTLANLQTFSTLSLTFRDVMEKILRRLPHIQKLKCICSKACDDAEKCNQLPQLAFLSQLVSLRMCYNGDVKYHINLISPQILEN